MAELDPKDGLDRLAVRRFGAGARVRQLQRLTAGARQQIYAFDVEADGQVHPLILRRHPVDIDIREGATPMWLEAEMIGRAAAAGAPVPEVVHVLDAEDGLGNGYVMARVAGESLARRILRDSEFAAARAKLPFQLGAAAAQIHRSQADGVPLRRTGVQQSLATVEQLYAANAMARPVVDWALRWLHANAPAEPQTLCVVHGDLRNGNIMVGPEGLRAILDWEGVHLGDPAEDLAWPCVTSWRFGQIDQPVGGLGPRAALFDGYESITGVRPDADRVRFYEILGTLRWGLSCAMMAREFQAGDRSVERAAIGRRASETEIDLLSILAPLKGMQHA